MKGLLKSVIPTVSVTATSHGTPSHATTGCSQEDFASWNGAGLFYCFAVDATP